MLIRRYSDPAKTVRKNRQAWPKYAITRQEVILDPWEEDSCAEAIRYAIGDAITVSDVTTEGWFRMAGGQLSIGQDMVRVLEDPQTGYIYYRRPIDIERQQKWNRDKKFRVKSTEWWDTDELNQWWENMITGNT